MEGEKVDLTIDTIYKNSEVPFNRVDRTIKYPNYVVLGTYRKGEAPTKETLFKTNGGILRNYNKADDTSISVSSLVVCRMPFSVWPPVQVNYSNWRADYFWFGGSFLK